MSSLKICKITNDESKLSKFNKGTYSQINEDFISINDTLFIRINHPFGLKLAILVGIHMHVPVHMHAHA